MYNLFWQPPPPLVPRYLRLEIEERLFANGKIHTDLNTNDVKKACKNFIDEGVNSIAIAFMNAYSNKEHELIAKKILIENGFDGEISLSSLVSGEYREYERTTTTIIDAFVKARMSNYLNTLKNSLNEIGFKGSFLLTRSGSGSMTFDEARTKVEENLIKKMKFESLSLGKVKSDLNEAEPILRDSNLISFNIKSIKSGDINNAHQYPNGLTSYEFCSLSRFSGASLKSNVISYFENWDFSILNSLLAESVWYVIDGFSARIDETPDSDNAVSYTHLTLPTTPYV